MSTASSGLSAADRSALREQLAARAEGLRKQLADHLHGETPAERAHEVLTQDGDDAPQRLPERDIAAALTLHEQTELASVRAALARMDAGSYGICADCGCDIPVARLKVEPWAETCIGCATQREQQAKR